MKLYDICFKAGEYQDSQTGETKARYKNVGVILNGEYGPYMILDTDFNPAGVPRDPQKPGVILKLFKNEKQQQGPDPAAGPAAQPQGAPVFNPNPPAVGQSAHSGGAGVDNGQIPF